MLPISGHSNFLGSTWNFQTVFHLEENFASESWHILSVAFRLDFKCLNCFILANIMSLLI